jgi:enoyl-CoA hydratase/carnithine racemase
MEVLLLADKITPARALEMGLVNRVVARDDLDATVDELAEHVARAPLSTLMATKQLVKRAWELMGMRMHLQMSTDVMAVTAKTRDAHELRMDMAQRGLRPRQQAERTGDEERRE